MTQRALGLNAATIGAACLCASGALASPTGLNNIVTADTPGHRQIVFQAFAVTDADDVNEFFAAFKGGLDLSEFGWAPMRFEYGVDGRLGEAGAGPTVAQFKLATDPSAWRNEVAPLDWAPMIAVGLSNLAFTTGDRRDAGQPNPYIVASKDIGVFRAHAGFGFASDNHAAFFGVDRGFDVGSTRLTPRFDITQIDDQDQWLGSAGFIWKLTKHIAVESWVSQPFDDGDTTFTLKFNIGYGF